MADQADMALNLWRQLGITKAHLVSHDMGDSVLTEILSRRDRNVLPDYFKDFFQVRVNFSVLSAKSIEPGSHHISFIFVLGLCLCLNIWLTGSLTSTVFQK